MRSLEKRLGKGMTLARLSCLGDMRNCCVHEISVTDDIKSRSSTTRHSYFGRDSGEAAAHRFCSRALRSNRLLFCTVFTLAGAPPPPPPAVEVDIALLPTGRPSERSLLEDVDAVSARPVMPPTPPAIPPAVRCLLFASFLLAREFRFAAADSATSLF